MAPLSTSLALAVAGAAGVILAGPAAGVAAPDRIVGGVTTYAVKQGDTLRIIGARYGTDPQTLVADNALPPSAILRVGQRLTIDNRHIVPGGVSPGAIVVNVPQRMLYYGVETDDVRGMPVAAGQRGWPTPIGEFTVVTKKTDPSWEVPASILEEARQRGRPLPAIVPPGPANPLGKFWLGLSVGHLGIHGTNAPSSVYGTVTHGCIRLGPDDIAWLYAQVTVGTPGRFVYEPVLVTADGSEVFLEVHADVYQRTASASQLARDLASAEGVMDRVDWVLADAIIAARHGIARRVTVDITR
ncbi:MAG TPA: L,D-transpeptidase family protein [Vicinamibacterales bacterium]|nr:L,D-transpeptidase family protein [Vicinamibacterales bacterium]